MIAYRTEETERLRPHDLMTLSERQKILIVDDLPANLVALRELLKPIDAEVIEAGSGNDALALTVEHDFAALLVDVDMPVMDGFEFAELTRGVEKTRTTPIIFITAAFKDREHRIKGYRTGAVDYIEKPIDEEILLSKVQVFLDLDHGKKEIERLNRELSRSLDELKESEERFRDLYDNAPDLYVSVDAKTAAIVQCNNTMAAMLGRAKDDIIGSPIFDVYHADCMDLVHEAFETFVATGEVHRDDLILKKRNGEKLFVSLNVTALRDKDGQILRSRSVWRDISEQKAAERALAARTEELERSNEELKQFAFVASHDLQEPLNLIEGFLNVLNRTYGGKMGPDADEYIGYTLDGVARMRALIKDLQAYSRVQSKGEPFVDASLNEVADEAMKNLAAAVEESKAEVVIADLPTLPVDRGQIARLFQNLIGNALKYRKKDAPPVVRLDVVEEAGGAWRFSVRDNGIGIAPEFFDKVFVIFQRLHTKKHFPGTGVGLAICKRIVQRHGGRIWIESTPGQGSVFHFTLPAERSDGDFR